MVEYLLFVYQLVVYLSTIINYCAKIISLYLFRCKSVENFVALLSKDCGYPQSVAFRHDRVDKHKVIPGFFHSFPQGYPHRNDNVLCIVNKILWITDRVSCIMCYVNMIG